MPAGVKFIGNQRSQPQWMADWAGREHLAVFPAKVDASQFNDGLGLVTTVGVAGAAQSATSIPIAALTYPVNPSTVLIAQGNVLIPSGTVLYFGGTGKFAKLTADAVYGATSLTVQALPTALVSGDAARYSRYGARYIPSGTLVGRTYAERDANTPFGPAAVTDDEIYLLAFDVADALDINDAELYRNGERIKENYLPDYTTLSTGAVEVQTVAVDTILSGGKIGITAIDSSGVPQTVVVAYNASWTQTVADIQTALIAVLGTSAVAAAVTATKNMTLTFSGAGYTGIAQPPVGVDISAATGPTKATVTRTTAGGTGLLTIIRQRYQCLKGAN